MEERSVDDVDDIGEESADNAGGEEMVSLHSFLRSITNSLNT